MSKLDYIQGLRINCSILHCTGSKPQALLRNTRKNYKTIWTYFEWARDHYEKKMHSPTHGEEFA